MATASLERMFDDWALAWTSNDPELVLALFVDDCLFEDVTFGVVAHGKEELRSFANRAFAAIPDFKYRLTGRFATEEWGVIEWVMSGTHTGDLPGIPATGRRFSSVRGTTVLELEAGKIRRESDYWDAATFMKEVGLMSSTASGEAAKAVVRRNTEEVQGQGRFDVFDQLFADDFVDHTPQPDMTPDKAGVRKLYTYIRAAFPDFHAEIHWQLADGDRVTTYKTYYGTHEGPLFGIAPTHRKIHFESVDVMRVHDGKITDHWGVGNLFSLMQQLGGSPAATHG